MKTVHDIAFRCQPLGEVFLQNADYVMDGGWVRRYSIQLVIYCRNEIDIVTQVTYTCGVTWQSNINTAEWNEIVFTIDRNITCMLTYKWHLHTSLYIYVVVLLKWFRRISQS